MAIDPDQHRRDIAEITIDLIAREGLAAATMRRIAAEAGSSTTAITHYFDDKEELLVLAFQVLSKEGERRFEEVLRDDPSDPIAALLTMVPWCPVNVRRWKAYLAFWDEAARNPDLAALLTRSTDAGTSLLRGLIAAQDAADVDKAGRLLSAIVQGMALQMLVDGRNWSEAKARAMLREGLELSLS